VRPARSSRPPTAGPASEPVVTGALVLLAALAVRMLSTITKEIA
jgi:hypothetical protein